MRLLGVEYYVMENNFCNYFNIPKNLINCPLFNLQEDTHRQIYLFSSFSKQSVQAKLEEAREEVFSRAKGSMAMPLEHHKVHTEKQNYKFA